MENGRKHIRFYPEPLEIALVSARKSDYDQFKKSEEYHFQAEFIGLIENMSHTGCSLVFIEEETRGTMLAKDTLCVIKLGKLDPLRGKVVWRQKIDTRIIKVGLDILD